MIQDIYAALGGLDGDANLVDAVVKVAKVESAHVHAQYLVQMPSPAMDPYGLLASPSVAELYNDLRAENEFNARGLLQALLAAGISAGVEAVDVFVEDRVSLAGWGAQMADLTIVSSRPDDVFKLPCWRDLSVGVLMRSGRPMLVVPLRRQLTWPPERICVAWNESRECSRAIYDAMPLLVRAATVQVLRAGDAQVLTQESAAPILAYLARHGVNAQCVDLDTSPAHAGQAIVDHACRVESDLIVAGGYGHSRLREWVLGGVSQCLFEQASVPVFFAH